MMRGGHRLMVVFSVLRYSLAFSSTKPRTFSMLSLDRMGVSKSKSYFSVRTSQDLLTTLTVRGIFPYRQTF